MDQAQSFWLQTQRLVAKHKSAYLAVVSQHSKGSPGRTGFKMLQLPNGDSMGTIGGGVMELKLQQKLSKQLCRVITPNEFEKLTLYHNKSAPLQQQSGLICSGSQTVEIFLLQAHKHCKQLAEIAHAAAKNLGGMIAYEPSGPKWKEKNKHCDVFTETLCAKFKVFVIGAGHVGTNLGLALKNLDMESYVFDHRLDIGDAFDLSVWDHVFLGSYESILKTASQIKGSIYACVVSTSMQSDYQALKYLLKIKQIWIGLMGAEAKIMAIKKLLSQDGFTNDQLNKINSPIGIQINSQTAWEIAISISAQLIKMKNKNDF